VTLLNKELPTIKKESDCLVKINDIGTGCKDDEFILHLEFQSSYDENMPHRMLSYYTRIFDKYNLPIYPVVMYLYPDRPRLNIPDTYASSIYNNNILTFKYKVLKVWEMEVNRIIDNDLYGLFPILPLIRHKTIDDKVNLAKCFDLVQNIDIEDNTLKADIYVCTGILAGLRYPKEMIESLMKVEIMQESEIYQDILNKGMEKGIEKGMEKKAWKKVWKKE
jgi:predicted transposase YdaD